MQVTVSSAKMWLTIFVVIMQMGVSVAIMQLVFFLQCIMLMTVSIVIMQASLSFIAM